MPGDKLWCVQAARGIACILIVYVHWIGALIDPNGSATFVHIAPLDSYTAPSIAQEFVDCLWRVVPSAFREVYFGLGLFFLVSGFVIPLSMGKGTQRQYLLRRVFRIYPVVIVSMLVALAVISFVRWRDGMPPAPLSLQAVLANLFLVRDIFLMPFLDNSLWTLEVEMHFYLLCFFIGWRNGHMRAWVILSIAGAFCAAAFFAGTVSLENTWRGVLLNVFGMNSCFITLMLVGTALYNGKLGTWSKLKTAIVVSLLLGANSFSLHVFHEINSTDAYLMLLNHISAAIAFISLLLFGNYLPYLRWLDKLANLSYPLYLLHGATAYAVFSIGVKQLGSIAAAATAAVLFTAAMTYLVHKYVELPGMKFGKRWTQSTESSHKHVKSAPSPNP